MKGKTGQLFVVAVSLFVVICSYSTMKLAFSKDRTTSASGFSDSEQDDKNKGGISNCNTLFGGNVGIGIAEPKAKLHIGGSIGVDGIMFPDGTLQTTAGGVEGGEGGNWTTDNNDIYSINPGNVGIGTNTPTSKLEVIGNIKSDICKWK